MKPVAALIPARMEVPAKGIGYRWVDGYRIISPEGKEIYPYMGRAAARLGGIVKSADGLGM